MDPGSEFPLLTVGHSNRSWPEFLRVLQAGSVTAIFDVRRFPVSRRLPHFCKEAMIPALRAVSIGYRHFPDLGGYRDDKAAATESANDGWPPGFLRNYADYALTEKFGEALGILRRAMQPGNAIMCAEKNWRDCHRQIIADYMIAGGCSVIHVIDEHVREVATLSSQASQIAHDKIIYVRQPSQFQLPFAMSPGAD